MASIAISQWHGADTHQHSGYMIVYWSAKYNKALQASNRAADDELVHVGVVAPVVRVEVVEHEAAGGFEMCLAVLSDVDV